MAKAWRTLQGWKLVQGEVGSTEFKLWDVGLQDLPILQIEQGVIKAKDYTGWFGLPAFRELCQITAEDLGLPDVLLAYREAAQAKTPVENNKFSHPIVYHAGRLTGWFELRQFSEHKILPVFKLRYAELVDKILRGESIAEPKQVLLASSSQVPLSKIENKIQLKKIREELGL